MASNTMACPVSPMLDRLRRHFATLTPRQWAICCTLAIVSLGLALGFALLFRSLNRRESATDA